MSESPYIRLVKNKDPGPDPDYVHDLVVLRAMVRQEDRQGDIGWGGTWTKERYQRLRDEHPEALMAFEAEIRWAKEEARIRRETFERHKDSPYLEEQRRAYPENPDKERYLQKIGRLRYVMILFSSYVSETPPIISRHPSQPKAAPSAPHGYPKPKSMATRYLPRCSLKAWTRYRCTPPSPTFLFPLRPPPRSDLRWLPFHRGSQPRQPGGQHVLSPFLRLTNQ